MSLLSVYIYIQAIYIFSDQAFVTAMYMYSKLATRLFLVWGTFDSVINLSILHIHTKDTVRSLKNQSSIEI